jgi:hypothetical protein
VIEASPRRNATLGRGPEAGLEEINGDLLEADFWTRVASKRDG